jgi:stearoyl-CoA desaturase (delta-9 desaturase)
MEDPAQGTPAALRARMSWWRVMRNAVSVCSFGVVTLALVAIPFIEVNLWSFAVTVIVVLSVGLSVTIGYHRYFSHRSFDTSRWFQFLLGLVGCMALQKGPLWWAATHRLHHRHSDQPDDPHSPVLRGFWYAHIGWMFSRDILAVEYGVVKDLAKCPELVWLNRLWMLPGLVFAAACYLALGWSGVVIGYCLPLAAMFQVTFAVNSVCHLFGSRRFDTGEESRNNWLIGILANGEGWHNNHHRAPYSARHGFAWYELDPSYLLIRLFAWLGLVWNVKLPPAELLTGVDQNPYGEEPAPETAKPPIAV